MTFISYSVKSSNNLYKSGSFRRFNRDLSIVIEFSEEDNYHLILRTDEIHAIYIYFEWENRDFAADPVSDKYSYIFSLTISISNDKG